MKPTRQMLQSMTAEGRAKAMKPKERMLTKSDFDAAPVGHCYRCSSHTGVLGRPYECWCCYLYRIAGT